ncbi:MAG: Cobalamin import system permease protein BtuC [Methanomassiliicoccales archaeon PtaU1.Bin124]|nr:MAG: Cobalamin import system permease protein BtuC [Methanomassiliicoccales archaeon PtaU1.Bin124]
MEQSHVGRTKSRLWLILGLGTVSLFILFLISLSVGSYNMSWSDALQAFINSVMMGGDTSAMNTQEKIVFLVRFPRFLAAIAVGIGLAIAGAIMQAIVRNPLVDPYITGVASGASFGAIALTMLGFASGTLAVYLLPMSAFIGAILAFIITMSISEAAGGKAIAFVLSGVVVAYAFSAFTNIIIVSNPDQHKSIMFWMFGSLASADLTQDAIMLIALFFIGAAALLYARELNVLLLGDEQANQLGVNSRRLKLTMMVLASVMTAVCVAFTGVIAFLGLLVPHIARIIVGSDHRLLLPASMMIGANFLLVTDIVTKMNGDLPIGAVISLIGAPFFGYLLISRGRDYGS